MGQLDANTGIDLARGHLAKGKPTDALKALDRVSWADLGWPEYWLVRAEAFYQMQDYKKAASSAKTGLEEDPLHLPLLILQTRAQFELGQFEEAYAAVLQGLKIHNRPPELVTLHNRLEEKLETLAKVDWPWEDPKPKVLEDAPAETVEDVLVTTEEDSPRPVGATPSVELKPPHRVRVAEKPTNFNSAEAEAMKRAFKNPTLETPVPPSKPRRHLDIPAQVYVLIGALVLIGGVLLVGLLSR